MWEGTICCLRNSSVSLEIMPAIVTHISCVFENFESYFLSWLRLSHCREPLRVDCLDLCISVFYSLSLYARMAEIRVLHSQTLIV
jgi:hypothetical protein